MNNLKKLMTTFPSSISKDITPKKFLPTIPP
jgi:hypothetical protein